MRHICPPIWLLCGALIAGGCATTNDSPALPDFQRVALVMGSDARENLNANSTAGMATAGAAGGAAGGAATGAAIGLACGPLALFCVPVGVVVGGVTGAAAGGITQGGKGLSKDHSKQANAVLEGLQTNLNINLRLHNALRGSLPETMQTDAAQAEALVTVRARLIELRQHSNERVSLRLIAEMHSTWDRELERTSSQMNLYEFETAREYVEDWLANDGQGFTHGLEQCIERVAKHMARDLGSAR